MTDLREKYLTALRESCRQSAGKQLISKSSIGPQIYCLRNADGEVVGFAPGEPLPAKELEQLRREQVQKSALSSGEDANAIFDDLFDFAPDTTEVVAKSVECTDEQYPELAGIFPKWLQ